MPRASFAAAASAVLCVLASSESAYAKGNGTKATFVGYNDYPCGMYLPKGYFWKPWTWGYYKYSKTGYYTGDCYVPVKHHANTTNPQCNDLTAFTDGVAYLTEDLQYDFRMTNAPLSLRNRIGTSSTRSVLVLDDTSVSGDTFGVTWYPNGKKSTSLQGNCAFSTLDLRSATCAIETVPGEFLTADLTFKTLDKTCVAKKLGFQAYCATSNTTCGTDIVMASGTFDLLGENLNLNAYL